ncbi:hypothetical protein [Paracoccus sp. Ld10]|uniref:hypothetical protein n=1 Tax=Paracoccus sp. Ld10 TaxID=649158 RepID=UPI003869C76E
MISTLPAFLLSAGLGLAGAAGIIGAVAARTVPLMGTQIPLAYLLPPVVGLAVFQLVFGTATGRWRGWRFWAASLPVSATIWGAGLIALLGGYASWQIALGGAAAGHVLAGLTAVFAGRRSDT